MEKILLKDIIIPKGTVFKTAPTKTERYGPNHLETNIGLTKDSCGSIEYCVEDDPELKEWFAPYP
jgi:hypothetical protein